ncbi:hypothetical protein FQN54_006358 [Arachnomyces sp. PD_36]|nr:hypothetical protein FQN54_006358 [Arachnomyces sp. PD_36]
MASNSVPSRVRKLDPTKLVSSKFVRRPDSKGKVIQGKPREDNSRAARRWRIQESSRLKKALKHVSHGKNIFVYNHLRTNQVVYSLTRALNFRTVLSQLIYHRKKTVPANLRKDMWTPYYSLHFPSSAVGLNAYRILRELSVQRQLAPDPDTITITEEVVERSRPRDPNKFEEWDEEWKDRIGHYMDKKQRARVLMDQKATSVADVAAMLEWQGEENKLKEAAAAEEAEGEGGKKYLSKKAYKRLRKVREREEQIRQQVAKRLEALTEVASGQKAVVDLPEDALEYDVQDGEVKILWADLEDAKHAEAWPEGVSHGELKRTADHIIQGAKIKRSQSISTEAETEASAPTEGTGRTEAVRQPATEATQSQTAQEAQEDSPSWKKKLKFW